MKCPHCENQMQAGAVRIGTSTFGWWYGLLGGFRGVVQYSRNLIFTAAGDGKEEILLHEEIRRAAYRCPTCRTLVVLDGPPEPPPALAREESGCVVRIDGQQQTRTARRAVYDSLRKQHIPHPIASRAANAFHSGLQVELPISEADQARAVLDEFHALGLVAQMVDPAVAREGKTKEP